MSFESTPNITSIPALDEAISDPDPILLHKCPVAEIISPKRTKFHPEKPIRFNRLFTPKPQHLPNIWRDAQRRRNKRKLDVVTPAQNPHHEFKTSWQFSDGTPLPPASDEIVEEFHKPWSEIPGLESFVEFREECLSNSNAPLWRHGPAEYWYNALGLPENPINFDYGFQLKPPESPEGSSSGSEDYPPGTFDLVTHTDWENNIVWDASTVKRNEKRTATAGWLPEGASSKAPTLCWPCPPTPSANIPTSRSSWASSLSVENPELVHGRWEDDIIWDHTAMTKIPQPKVLTFDPNDENLVLVPIVDELRPTKQPPPTARPKAKASHPHSQMSRLILGKVGVINEEYDTTEDVPPPVLQSKGGKDPYNISNDEFYQPKSTTSYGSLKSSIMLQHSVLAFEFRPPFMPQRLNEDELRIWHRPRLQQVCDPQVRGPRPIHPLTDHINKMSKRWERARLAAGGSEHGVLMQTANDLTGRNGELILVENCEEYPPLLSQTGMCSKIINHYKRGASVDKGPPQLPYGTVHLAHTSPFLGKMHQGQVITAIENNMYRAPIYQHVPGLCDFLVIRIQNEYYIREIDAMFTAGQHCPLMEVPVPNSKKATDFLPTLLQAFIYRMFLNSKECPKSVRTVDVMAAFPMVRNGLICRRLKKCADLKRTGFHSPTWVLKPSVRLPSEDELREMVTPEQCCTYFSLLAGQQRLSDAGYGGKPEVIVESANDENSDKMNDDEEKAAPWNTTRAYVQAMSGKCFLQLSGPADPTGCGEGFSYVRTPKQPMKPFTHEQSKSKKLVTGTDADLRRLSVTKARTILHSLGIPLKHLKNMGRWQLIDLVRTFHSEKNKEGGKGAKFSRNGRPLSLYQERYRKECQRIFDLQNRILASEEVLSTDDNDSEVEATDAEMEEMAKHLENLLTDKITSDQATHQMEEAQRMDLKKMMLDKRERNDVDPEHNIQRILRIVRTFRTDKGKEYKRTEIVRDSTVIDAYLKKRGEPEPAIRNFALLTNETKHEMTKEKRSLQERIRRINKTLVPVPRGKADPKKKTPVKTMTCGACRQVGHMKSNRACPKFNEDSDSDSVTSDDVNVEELEEEPDNLVKVEGTKLSLSAKLIPVEEQPCLPQLPVILKISKGKPIPVPSLMKRGRKRGAPPTPENDYLIVRKRSTRQRIDPAVVMGGIFETIVNNLRKMKVDVENVAGCFNEPVKTKDQPNYYQLVRFPMDLHTIREKVRMHQYPTREAFLADVELIRDNSSLYNGHGCYTNYAQNLVDSCKMQLEAKADELERMEVMINPLLDVDTQKGLNFILESCIEKLKLNPKYALFIRPVPKKTPLYYQMVKKPMNLDAMLRKIKSNVYTTAQDFMSDLEQISSNALFYNGKGHMISESAKNMVTVAREFMGLQNENLTRLEKNVGCERETDQEPGPSSLVDDTPQPFLEQVKEEDAMTLRFFRKAAVMSGLVPQSGHDQCEGIPTVLLKQECCSPTYQEEGEPNLYDDLALTSSDSDTDCEFVFKKKPVEQNGRNGNGNYQPGGYNYSEDESAPFIGDIFK